MLRPGTRPLEAPPRTGPALITFTARAGAPLIPVYRSEDELLAQGAMTVLALSLDSRDVILNPYPLTGPAGLALALAPWLISGAVLAQHQPFDYAVFVQQLLATGATVTALPSPVLEELAKDRVLEERRCALRRLGAVWTTFEHTLPLSLGTGALLFDLYPLGDLASIVLRRETRSAHSPLPLGPIKVGEDGDGAVFVETRLRKEDADARVGEVLLRGPSCRKGPAEASSCRMATASWRRDFAPRSTRMASLRACASPAMPSSCIMAASPLPRASSTGSIRAFPDFSTPRASRCPIRCSATASSPRCRRSRESPSRSTRSSRFSRIAGVAPYKFPDKLLVVNRNPARCDRGASSARRSCKQV